jgi:hypothetical protein
MNITFTKTYPISDEFLPIPASKCVPSWYKEMNSYIGKEKKPNGDGQTTATIKKCLPVFDAITAGYILLTPVDVYVTQKASDENGVLQPYYEWPSNKVIEWHPVVQAPTHPANTGYFSYPKWINPWAISTPRGYSVLFTAPKHRDNVFTILDGVVDTDSYNNAVNFPFVLNDINFEGLIPAGTPMAQVIPFKREKWDMKLGGTEELDSINKTNLTTQSRFFDKYRNHFWHRKEYK